MKAVEASAKTREEAIQGALKQLGVEMYEVDKIEIIDEGSKGLFGFGARPVRVRLVVENMPDDPQRPAAAARPQRENNRGERSERGRNDRGQNREKSETRGRNENRESTDKGESTENREKQNARAPRADRAQAGTREGNRGKGRDARPARGERSERGEGRGRGERGDKPADAPQQPRGERDAQRTRPEKKERPPRAERPERKERPERPERKERLLVEAAEGEAGNEAYAAGPDPAAVDTTAPITDEQGVEAATLLEEIIAKMGIAATAAFVRSEDGSARINVSSEDSAILIGRKGRNLSAMQYLINRMISRGDTNENTERIVVDVEGYVDRRRESLEELALSMASRAKETQRNMRLKPLSPQERRIIHLTLQGDEDIRTFSLGDSLFRSVVISPKDAVRPERTSRSSRGNRGGRRRGGRGRSGSGDSANRNGSQDIDVGALSD